MARVPNFQYSYTVPLPARVLHKNCDGCGHVNEKGQCRYFYTPSIQKRWPCWFRENVNVQEAGADDAVSEEVPQVV